MNIGARIKELRNKKNLTMKTLASRINTTQQTISNYERNISKPDIPTLENICSALDITLAEFFVDDPPEVKHLEPNLKQLLETAKKLTPRQIELLQETAEEYVISATITRRKRRFDRSISDELKKQYEQDLTRLTTRKRRKRGNRLTQSGEEWYIEEIKNGRPLNDANFLCRLVNENIIKPTMHGQPLTQEQKEGLVNFIKSNSEILSAVKNDNQELPEDYAAHDESENTFDLNREPELAALIRASDIINEMLHRYLKEN